MKKLWIAAGVVLAAYLATGFYVVRGNEKAAVRRFGRVVRTAEGQVALAGSGLKYTLPWPCSEIERINLNEVRTLSIGMGEIAEPGAGGFLRSLEAENRSQFLTGDKNILHLQINTQYRVGESSIEDFLFREAALLDDWKLTEWVALFEPGATYRVPPAGAPRRLRRRCRRRNSSARRRYRRP